MDRLEKLEHISRLPLFSELETDEIALLEPLFHEETYRAGDYIYRQAERTYALYLFVSGRGRLLRVGPDGIERKGADVDPGEFVGEKSLFLHDERPNSLLVVREATVLVLARRDFEDFIRRYPNIKARLNVRDDIIVKVPERDFAWLNRGEIVLRFTHRHIWAFWRRAAAAIPIAILMFTAAIVIWLTPVIPDALAALPLLLAVVLPILYIAYCYFDWLNDWFVITNQRVLREERILLTFTEMRQQAPLNSIQSVHTQRTGYLDARLNFGNLVIATAGSAGNVVFNLVPDPDGLAAIINRETSRSGAHRAASDREKIRTEIDRFLGVNALNRSHSDVIPQPGERAPDVEPITPVLTSWQERWNQWMTYLDVRVRVDEGYRIVYRRHWLILLRNIFGPFFFLMVALVAALMAVRWRHEWPWNAFHPLTLLLAFIAAFGGLLFWLWFEFADWRDDQYIVEDTMLTKIHRRPLWLQNIESHVPIRNIQNVDVRVTGFWQQMLSYGTVIVQTAAETAGLGTGQTTFSYIYQPYALQDDILRRLREGTVRQEEDEQTMVAEQIARWLAVYHQATHTEDFGERAMNEFIDKGEVAESDLYHSEDV